MGLPISSDIYVFPPTSESLDDVHLQTNEIKHNISTFKNNNYEDKYLSQCKLL